MPVVHPADVWRESGRYDAIGPELVRFKDRGDRDMVLAMTHEEVVAILLRDIVQSYRQLPMIVYHFQTKFRDEPRSRGGLIRVREFVMKDSYSCDRDDGRARRELLARTTRPTTRIFERLGLEAIPVSSDVGIMGGSGAHEFMVAQPDFGEDILVLCDDVRLRRQPQIARRRASPARSPRTSCRWRRSRRRARRRSTRSPPSSASRESKTAKAAFFVTGDGRLRRRHRARRLRRQRDEARERRQGRRRHSGRRRSRRSGRAAWRPGYGSPIGARDAVVVVDELVARSPNLVAGANRVGWHVRNVNVPPRLRAGRHRRHHERPRGRSLPESRRDA